MPKKDISLDSDFTTGSVERKLVKFSIPIIIGSILMQFYNYVDSVIVGRFVGKEALAAIGATTPFVFMLISLIIGISMGTTILIAQYYGKNDLASIKKASDSLYIFLSIAAVVITALGLTFNRQIMELISLPEEVIPHAVAYLDVYLIGLIFLFVFNSLSAILRGIGDSKSPLLFLVITSVLNIILDIVFVAVFNWGIEGAAWATVISQALAVVFALRYISKNNKIISTDIPSMRFDRATFIKSLKIGVPAGLQQLFVSIGMLFILKLVNGYGTDTIAGYSAASRIEAFVFVIPMNFSMALTSFTAQNFGANRMDRVRLGVRSAIRVSFIASFVILVLLSALALPLMQMFSSELEVINVGARYLYVLGISYFIVCAMFIYMGVLRGMGNTVVPMIVTLFSLWIVRLPIAKILSSTHLEELGIWIASPISWSMGLAAAYIYYRKGYKKAEHNSSH